MSGGDSNNNTTAHKRCGLTQVLIFLTALVTGTACSICSKTMMEQHGLGKTGEMELFDKPLFQTFGMFVGMVAGLVLHAVVLYWRLPFPGYVFHDCGNNHTNTSAANTDPTALPTETDALVGRTTTRLPDSTHTPAWMYWFLIIPAVFDVGATGLCMMGLQYLDVSLYQMLRGSGIIFVALMKQHVLKDRLYGFQWVGVAWNVVSVVLVGSTALLNSSSSSNTADADATTTDTATPSAAQALTGVLLVLAGAFVQALQFVFEEKVMTMDVPSPPLLLIGMEGVWGTVICAFVLYPLAYYVPGDDHGSYEDPFNTWHMLTHSTNLQIWFVVYFWAILGYNIFACLVTFLLNSIWHAILDNFRPITIWGADLFIYYAVTTAFGESWTSFSWIQVVAMVVLLYGTAIYNGPNPGSIQLKGCCCNCSVCDFTEEYADIERRLEDERLDAEWLQRKASFAQKRNTGSFAGEWLGTPRM